MPLSLMLTVGFLKKHMIDVAFMVSFFGYFSCGILNKMSSASEELSQIQAQLQIRCRLDAELPQHTLGWAGVRPSS